MNYRVNSFNKNNDATRMLKILNVNPGIRISRKFGYARVSTDDQDLSLQLNALNEYGVHSVYQEKVSAASSRRPEFEKMLKAARGGDTIVVWKLDRLARSVKKLWEIVEQLERDGIELVVLTEQVDTKTASGRMLTNILGSLAQFEREQIQERTIAGIEAKRRAGHVFGRRHAIKDDPKRLEIMQAYVDGGGDLMTIHPNDALKMLNEAYTKARRIKSPETFRRWRREGFPGIEKPE